MEVQVGVLQPRRKRLSVAVGVIRSYERRDKCTRLQERSGLMEDSEKEVGLGMLVVRIYQGHERGIEAEEV